MYDSNKLREVLTSAGGIKIDGVFHFVHYFDKSADSLNTLHGETFTFKELLSKKIIVFRLSEVASELYTAGDVG
ncbi:hypothetical protein ACOI22_10670 [Glaciecola sp. 2405UD65-10]|uniref:hypothetical protein n=1 Tax=Glaciecola sp. 2405UD65-10 TaxID=3397244 RepID=UPI003B58C662